MWRFDYDCGIFSMVRHTNDNEKFFVNPDSISYLCSKEIHDSKDIDHILVRALHKYKAIVISYTSSSTKECVRNQIINYGDQFVSLKTQLEGKYSANEAFLKSYKGFSTIVKKLKLVSDDEEKFSRTANNLKGSIQDILKSISNSEEYVSALLNDYNKISTSSAFRRLQDKAQVFPLEMHDYARTRLTHTVEVSSIASEIANVIGKRINWKIEKGRARYSLEKIVECSSLMHDMGNPPYGHYGEDVIRQFFKDEWMNLETVIYSWKEEESEVKLIEEKKVKIKSIIDKEVDNQMYNDFSCFDGNAQALRVMTKLQRFKDAQPIELSLCSLGAIIKYPFNSVVGEKKKKFGYFYSEEDVIKKLSTFGVFWEKCRNPLSLILEAADDISYVTSDLEDAVKKGVITKEIFDIEISNIRDSEDLYLKDFASDYDFFYQQSVKRGIKDPFLYTISRLIDNLKKKLILQVSEAFCQNYNAIMKGVSFEGEEGNKNKQGEYIDLLDYSQVLCKGVAEWIREKIFKNYLYMNTEIIQSELKGDAVMTTLLKEFSQAVLSLNFDKYNEKRKFSVSKKEYFHEQKVFSLISSNFVEGFFAEYDNAKNDKEKIYYKLKLVVDYVSGMTDSYALECYRILKGIQ